MVVALRLKWLDQAQLDYPGEQGDDDRQHQGRLDRGCTAGAF